MWMCRSMFSISTIASSTRIPVASVIARKLTRFSEKPSRSMIQKVGIAESGSATAEISVARQLRRNSMTTMTASSAPSISVCSAAS
ncbi:hypothetical protein D9M72_627170 [compost metagenome]